MIGSPRAWTRAALLVYCFWSILLISANPGLQYDEALLVLGSVHMQNSPAILTLPHDPDTWTCIAGRCFPLMTVRYVGAAKEYLCLPLFAIFGNCAEVLRLVSMLLGLIGIWGIARLLAAHAGPRTAALTAWVLAMHPAYVDLTIFDNGAVAIWMFAAGLLAMAVSRYLTSPGLRAALLLGVAMGFGIWARANFLWLLLAVAAALILVLRRRALPPVAHLAAIGAGGATGGAPFLIYQIVSGGGTWEAIGMFATTETLWQKLATRWAMFSEVLLSDREHRAIWGGPPLPDWQAWLFPAIVLSATVVCLASRKPLARVFALAFLIMGSLLFFSRLPVAEHHLIVLVPLAAVISVLGADIAWNRRTRIAIVLAAVVYFGCALHWQMSAWRRISETGGVGQWSDAVYPLAEHLMENYPGVELKILDWGLQNNLYMLTGGKLRSREMIDYPAGAAARGGVFLINGPANRNFPQATEAFLKELETLSPKARRSRVRQRNGAVYAEIIDTRR
jgi:hypothetical protein